MNTPALPVHNQKYFDAVKELKDLARELLTHIDPEKWEELKAHERLGKVDDYLEKSV